jgi:hypothetical protein
VEYFFGHDSGVMGRYREEEVLRWRSLVSEQAESGRSVAAFCVERGLRDWQLYEWKKRLRQTEATPTAAASFVAVEVSVPAAPVDPAEASVPVVGIELRHRRGWSLMIEPGFDACHLSRLLSVLEKES